MGSGLRGHPGLQLLLPNAPQVGKLQRALFRVGMILSPSRRMTRITVPRASPRPLTCSHLELEMSHQKPFFMAATAASLPPAISAHASHFIRRGERERIFQIITLFYERTSEGERKQALHSDSLGLRHVLSHTSLPSYKQ